MGVSHDDSNEMKALWNGAAGESWVAAADALDAMFAPFERLLVETARAQPRAWVLDVGCGTGSTTIALKKQLGADCQCVGVDISGPMLEHARARAEREGTAVSFLQADAEHHAFEPARFDLIVSRFGVMFFDDPVRAFENLRRAARDGAELCLVVWRGPEENPFMTAAERAATTVLPNVPAREPDAPGQFGFANASRVSRILNESGWRDVDISPVDVECTFPTEDLKRYVTRLGPLARLLREADEPTRARVLEVVVPAFDRYVHGEQVRFEAACWKISARR